MASAAPDGIYAIPTTGLIFALAITLCLLLLNSVASGLKDLKTDAAFGARSFVLSAGAKMLDSDRLTISPALKRYSFALQALFLATLLLLAIQSPPAFGIGVLALLLALYGALHLRMLLNVTSFRALRRSMPLLNGYYNYGALVLLVPLPAPLMLLAILCALALLTIPLQLAWRVWRERYAQIKPPSRQERQENTGEMGGENP